MEQRNDWSTPEGRQLHRCKYWVKHYEEGSEWGIDEGRISKLEIRINGKITANYDRGWDIEPEDETTQTALAILLKEYN